MVTIKKNSDYRKVYGHGKSVADRNIVLFFLANNKEFKRFGFTVSKKVGNAVRRNRVRRIFKEACRLNSDMFPEGFDFVLLARRDHEGLKRQQVDESLMKLLRKSRITRGCLG